MDELRGLAILLVIAHHVLTVPVALGGDAPEWQPVMDALLPYRMPLMLVLSGLLLPVSLRKPMAAYYSGKVRRILWPFLVWTVITAIVLLDPGVLADPWAWIGGAWHLWFLAVLLACYLAGPLTKWIPAWIWFIPMMLVSSIPDTNSAARLLWFGSFFFFGAALRPCVDRWIGFRPLIPCFMALVAVAYAVWVSLPAGEHINETPLAFLASINGALVAIWLAAKAPRARFLSDVGQRSMVFYLVHFPVIGVAYLVIGDATWWLLGPALVIVGYGVPWWFCRWSGTFFFVFPKKRRVERGLA